MICIQAPQDDFDPDLRSHDCREAMELALYGLISEAETKGWRAAEIAMALADAAEDYILLLAQGHASKH